MPLTKYHGRTNSCNSTCLLRQPYTYYLSKKKEFSISVYQLLTKIIFVNYRNSNNRVISTEMILDNKHFRYRIGKTNCHWAVAFALSELKETISRLLGLLC